MAPDFKAIQDVMRYLISLFFVLCWPFAAQALDLTTQLPVVSGYATSKVTSAPFDRKLILAAHDDAATFVATGGAVRGAQLEAALERIRRHNPELPAGDLELAQAILVQ